MSIRIMSNFTVKKRLYLFSDLGDHKVPRLHKEPPAPRIANRHGALGESAHAELRRVALRVNGAIRRIPRPVHCLRETVHAALSLKGTITPLGSW